MSDCTEKLSPGVHGWHPEMGDARPNCEIYATIGHSGRWYLKSKFPLMGRGINYLGTLAPSTLTEQGQRFAGWHSYRVTDLAFEKLKAQHAIGLEMLL